MTEHPWDWEASDGSMVMLGTKAEHGIDLAKTVMYIHRCKSCRESDRDGSRLTCGFPAKDDADWIVGASLAYHVMKTIGWHPVRHGDCLWTLSWSASDAAGYASDAGKDPIWSDPFVALCDGYKWHMKKQPGH